MKRNQEIFTKVNQEIYINITENILETDLSDPKEGLSKITTRVGGGGWSIPGMNDTETQSIKKQLSVRKIYYNILLRCLIKRYQITYNCEFRDESKY